MMIARVIALAGFGTFTLTTMANAEALAPVHYTCNDGAHVTAVFSAPGASSLGQVVLTIAEIKVTLPQVKSADGGRYANSEMEFWIRGKEATLTRGGRAEKCQTK